MFTIKNMEDGGYTAYECQRYAVQWKQDAPPRITLYGDDPTHPDYVDVHTRAFVTNDAGKTIDRVSGPGTPNPEAGV